MKILSQSSFYKILKSTFIAYSISLPLAHAQVVVPVIKVDAIRATEIAQLNIMIPNLKKIQPSLNEIGRSIWETELSLIGKYQSTFTGLLNQYVISSTWATKAVSASMAVSKVGGALGLIRFNILTPLAFVIFLYEGKNSSLVATDIAAASAGDSAAFEKFQKGTASRLDALNLALIDTHFQMAGEALLSSEEADQYIKQLWDTVDQTYGVGSANVLSSEVNLNRLNQQIGSLYSELLTLKEENTQKHTTETAQMFQEIRPGTIPTLSTAQR